MRINLNTIIATIGVSFSISLISLAGSGGETWYDSEGRPLIVVGKKVERKLVEVEDSKKEVHNPIIPKSLELRPELSTVKRGRSYPVYYPYSRYHYGHNGYYGSVRHHHYQNHYRGCYRSNGIYRNNRYLNYRKGGLNIRARF
jgi:hypothetical protein